jgi:hypothetical protein
MNKTPNIIFTYLRAKEITLEFSENNWNMPTPSVEFMEGLGD